jgi:deoxyribonuclease V
MVETEFSGRFSVTKAHELQLRLSKQVIKEDMLPEVLHYIGGVDVSYVGEVSIGVVVVLDFSSLEIVESRKARVRTRFPYIPTLLSWREIEPAKTAFKKLQTSPDVVLVDAQGIAHPYRFGFASHFGLALDKPTIGVAKSLLTGKVGQVNAEGWAPITDKGELVGAAVRRNMTEQPVYVSIGHRISLERAIEIVKHCMKSTRIPEPSLVAHALATQERMKYKQKQKASNRSRVRLASSTSKTRQQNP